MSKSLSDRLKVTKAELTKVDAALNRGAAKLSASVIEQFRQVTAFSADIDHMIGMIDARATARAFLADLEAGADDTDRVLHGSARVPYQHARLLGVHAYLVTTWSLADRMTEIAGWVLCTPAAGVESRRPAHLVNHFLDKERRKQTSGALYESIRQTFGWPIGVSYALRNHFVHDGATAPGSDFFEGPTAGAKFTVSAAGWDRIEARAKSYDVDPTYHRSGAAWPIAPRDDLRTVLDVCERETDDALGVLLGSACRTLVGHVGYLLGED